MEPSTLTHANDDGGLRFTAGVSDALFRAAYKRFWWHDWPQYAVAAAIVIPAFIIVWRMGYVSDLIWTVAGLVAVGLSIYFYRDYQVYLRTNLAARATLSDRQAVFSVRGDALHVEMSNCVAIYERSAFRGVLQASTFVVLVLDSVQFVIVPTAPLSNSQRNRLDAWLADINPS